MQNGKHPRTPQQGRQTDFLLHPRPPRQRAGRQLKPWTTTFEVLPTWTEKSARKRAEAFAATFEKDCREGITLNDRQTFQSYCDYVLELKESRGAKHSTIVRYRELTTRIYPAIGHIKLKDLRADHLNALYTALGKEEGGVESTYATAKTDLAALLKEKSLTRIGLAAAANLPIGRIYDTVKGTRVSVEAAKAISGALGISLEKSFHIEKSARTLSAKTVIEYHRLISTVLNQAEKEGRVPYNVAARATLPKVQKREVNYFQPEQIAAIREALELEPLKWKALVHLLLITGARRGEILGLKWDKVDMEGNRIYICNNILYSADRGIYEDTPKTATSKRSITLPAETMQLLRQYKEWQEEEKLRLEGYYQEQGFVFSQDNGKPMHPDSVTDWLSKFSKRHGLPHINPHAFRHTMASMLYFHGVDSVSISKRLGHAQVSTTANIYAHVMEKSDQRNADILADVFLKKG